MLTRELEFDLPPELIAQTPVEPRDPSRPAFRDVLVVTFRRG